MALILNLETSTPVCSVSLAKNGKVINLKESFEDKSHATLLTVFVEEILAKNKISVADLDAIAISQGPGSYTGLRIGVSVAKGLCYGANIPLIAIDTLKAMANMASDKLEGKNMLYCPMIDARRMEVYSELFDGELNPIRKVIAEIIDEKSYNELLLENEIAFFGDGAQKCQDSLTSKNALFIDDLYPSAKYMAKYSEEAYAIKNFKDVAYFEPFYLKDFVATTPKKKLL